MGERAASLVKFEETRIGSGSVSGLGSVAGLGSGTGTKAGTGVGSGVGSGLVEVENSTCLETRAATDFLARLLHADPHQRMSLRDAIHHPYLTHGMLSLVASKDDHIGVLSSDSPGASSGASSGTSPGHEAGAGATPVVLSPLTLHFQPPMVELPRSTPGGEAGVDDQLWARRQFSSLWAPTPGEWVTTWKWDDLCVYTDVWRTLSWLWCNCDILLWHNSVLTLM